MSTRKPTILISDDEPLLVHALAREARRNGLSFISDTESERTVELARAHHPDVIILDINQRIDGRDLLSKLKRDPDTASTPVVILSANDDQFTRRLCLELGAHDFQSKPLDPTFMVRVARLAQQHADNGATAA